MIANLFYLVLALFGIGFLIFIHELGHYFMAKKVGISVEVFSIGFGKSLIEWEKNNVKWKIGWIPFGGYVKMAGMEKKDNVEPSKVENGFFGAKPWHRIQTAAIGPLVNIIFALCAFSFLWFAGGREKPFSEFTHYIGWVDTDTTLYQEGIRSGDRITTINKHPIRGFNDFLYASILEKQALNMTGCKLDYWTGDSESFYYTFPEDRKQSGMAKASLAVGALRPAQYLVYDKFPSGAPNTLAYNSPMEKSGITYGDRILWVDGVLVFSTRQLSEVINSPKVLLTIEREGSIFLTRVPRLAISDLRLSSDQKEELDDWSYEAKLSSLNQLFFIPYNLNSENVVESSLGYIDEKSESKKDFHPIERVPGETPLKKGDKIVAVQGKQVANSYQLLQRLQKKKSLILVKKAPLENPPLWKKADYEFAPSFEMPGLKEIVNSIGTDQPISEKANLRLLSPITPIPLREFPLDEQRSQAREEKLEKYKKNIEEIPDPKKREEARKNFDLYQNRLMLGINLQDKTVLYNPSAFVLFGDVFKETYRTLSALVTGYLSPKLLSGPVGMVQVIHHGWTVGVKEAIFWLGMISLNLGIVNLLPIPVLDGGYIVLAIIETITKKPLKAKTMERLILPFVILVVGLFIYLTYHDLARLVGRFF